MLVVTFTESMSSCDRYALSEFGSIEGEFEIAPRCWVRSTLGFANWTCIYR